MARPRIDPHDRLLGWTAEDLAESYEALAEIEPLGEGPTEDVTTPERDELELVATVAAREVATPRAKQPSPAPMEAPADAETYAVLPALDLLMGIADYVRAEAARDDAGGETGAQARPASGEHRHAPRAHGTSRPVRTSRRTVRVR